MTPATSAGVAALLFDLGDTIMVEETEVKDAEGTTLCAELAPGMAEALRAFSAAGHRLALVADSRPRTPENVLRQHGLLELFETLAVSEVVGASDPRGGLRPRGDGGQQPGTGHRRGQPPRPDFGLLSPERSQAHATDCAR